LDFRHEISVFFALVVLHWPNLYTEFWTQ